MDVSCILTSYNRPRMIRDALNSVARQTHPHYELIIVDDSDSFDVDEVVREFGFPAVRVIRHAPGAEDIRTQNRLPMNCNVGLEHASGDLISYLCDDDYFYPEWVEKAACFFSAHPEVSVAFGKLSIHRGTDAFFPYEQGRTLFYDHPIADPFYRLDHNQVMHRHFGARFRWNESMDREVLDAPDAVFWRSLAKAYLFHPLDAFAAVKRMHSKNLQKILDAHLDGSATGLRRGPR
jgi:spore maturation protein CgeD